MVAWVLAIALCLSVCVCLSVTSRRNIETAMWIELFFFAQRLPSTYHKRRYTGWVKKTKLLILSEYVNKTEKIGGM